MPKCITKKTQDAGRTLSINSGVSPSSTTSCCESIKMNAMSIRVVTTLLCAFIILSTAVIVIAVTTKYSLDAAEEIAIDQASLIALKTKGDMESLLGIPLQYCNSWQYIMGAGSAYALPSESETDDKWFSSLCDRFVAPLAGSGFLFQYSGMGFEDGTYVGMEMEENETLKCSFFHWVNKSAIGSNTSSGLTGTVTIVTYHQSNYTEINRQTLPSPYDPRTRPWYNQVPHTKNAISWSDVYLSVGPTLPAVDSNAAIYNESGTFLGVVSLTYKLSTVSGFLSEISNTVKRATLIVLDNQDLVVASSYSTSAFLTSTTVTVPYNGTLSSNCLLSDASNDATLNIIVCRSSATTYGFTPLNELALSHADILATGTTDALQLTLDGTKYFVKVMHLETNPSTNWRVVLFLPSSVITHGVITGRNMSIYICIGVVAVTLLICATIVTLLLRPLHTLSERMYRAATMQGIDDDCDDFENSTNRKELESISYFQEISTIQLAFASLTSELSKVKGFLPQSVLEALYGNPSTGSTDGQLECNDESDLIDEGFGPGDSLPPSNRISFFQTSDGDNNCLSNSCSHTRVTQASSPPGDHSTAAASNAPATLTNSNNHIRSSGASSHVLNTSIGLKSKRVSVLIINICDYHQHLQNHTQSEIASGHSKIVKLIGDACIEQRGILDGFQGDRFVVSFNAVTTVVNHAHHAAKASASVAESFSSSRMFVSSGIGSGPALVGNIGSFSTKRFTVLSSVVSNAAALERLSKHYGPICGSRNTFVAGNAAADIENFFELMTIDGVVLPSSTANGTRVRIANIMGPKRASPGEWMYQLEEGAVKSEYGELNIAFAHLMKNEFTQAVAAASTSLRRMSRNSASYLGSGPLSPKQSVPVSALNPLTEPSVIRRVGTISRRLGSSVGQQQSWSVSSVSHYADGTTRQNTAEAAALFDSTNSNLSSNQIRDTHDRLQDLRRMLLQGVVAASNTAIQSLKLSDVRAESLTGDPTSFTSSNGDSSMYPASNNNTTTTPPGNTTSATCTTQPHPEEISSSSSLSLLGITDDFYGRCVLPALRATATSGVRSPSMGVVNGVASSSRAVGGLAVYSSYNSSNQSRATSPPPSHSSLGGSNRHVAVVTASSAVNTRSTKPFRSLADHDDASSSDYDQNIQDIAQRCGL